MTKYPHFLFLLATASLDAFSPSLRHLRPHRSNIATFVTSNDAPSDVPMDDDSEPNDVVEVVAEAVDDVLDVVSDAVGSVKESVNESVDDVFDAVSEAVESEFGNMVNNVLDLIPTSLGEVSESTRSRINEVLYKLEALNPTDKPAKSSLLNGEWELKYSGGYVSEGALKSPTRQIALFLYSGGYSPGIFALSLARKLPAGLVSVGDLKINIFEQQPRIQASVDLRLPLLGESSIQVKAELKTESDIRLRETYESAAVMGNTIEIPEMLQYSRELYVTYLDEDLLVVRDGSGVPELLVRPSKVSPM